METPMGLTIDDLHHQRLGPWASPSASGAGVSKNISKGQIEIHPLQICSTSVPSISILCRVGDPSLAAAMPTKLQPKEQHGRFKKRLSNIAPASFHSQSVAISLLPGLTDQENPVVPVFLSSPPPSPFSPASDAPVPLIIMADALDSPASSSVVTTATPTVVVAACEFENENTSVQTPVTSDADVAAALLGGVLSKVWASSDTNLQTKKILDAVLRLEIDAVEGQKALSDSAPSTDYRVVMLCVVMWTFMFLLVSARGFGGRDSAIDIPPPT